MRTLRGEEEGKSGGRVVAGGDPGGGGWRRRRRERKGRAVGGRQPEITSLRNRCDRAPLSFKEGLLAGWLAGWNHVKPVPFLRIQPAESERPKEECQFAESPPRGGASMEWKF